MWRHSYVVSADIATLPYMTLSCPILSCHEIFFTGSRKNNGIGTGSWLPVILPSLGIFFTVWVFPGFTEVIHVHRRRKRGRGGRGARPPPII